MPTLSVHLFRSPGELHAGARPVLRAPGVRYVVELPAGGRLRHAMPLDVQRSQGRYGPGKHIAPGALSRSLIGPTCERAHQADFRRELRPITMPTAEVAISLARCPLSDRCRAAGRAALGRCEPLGTDPGRQKRHSRWQSHPANAHTHARGHVSSPRPDLPRVVGQRARPAGGRACTCSPGSNPG